MSTGMMFPPALTMDNLMLRDIASPARHSPSCPNVDQALFADDQKHAYCGVAHQDVDISECCEDIVLSDNGMDYCRTTLHTEGWRACTKNATGAACSDALIPKCNKKAMSNPHSHLSLMHEKECKESFGVPRPSSSSWKVAGLMLLSFGLTAILHDGFF